MIVKLSASLSIFFSIDHIMIL